MLDGLSLAAIFPLAAIGLAITFGVMSVINMAHGEFITMKACTAYVVQLFVPDYTLSILLGLPLAFIVTFAAGVAMERLVIRFLYTRPLETLLATFGISIALQQIFKNVFGTQARPLTAPGWLDGAWVLHDVVGISYIRIAIFVLALLFLGVFLFIMKRTRLGLETRAVTQNPRMAAAMGINPDRVNMLTFGLGSGIAGIAGVAIGLFAKVTSELGSDYILQSFMTVVVGGVGNIFGALAGATMAGFPQAGIINPAEVAPIGSIYLAVWVAIGGRGRLYGAVIGAAFVSMVSNWFTSGQVPSVPLGFTTIVWVDRWQVVLGLSFVLVTLFAPKGIGGLFDLLTHRGTPDRHGADLGPDKGSLQEREAVQ